MNGIVPCLPPVLSSDELQSGTHTDVWVEMFKLTVESTHGQAIMQSLKLGDPHQFLVR